MICELASFSETWPDRTLRAPNVPVERLSVTNVRIILIQTQDLQWDRILKISSDKAFANGRCKKVTTNLVV